MLDRYGYDVSERLNRSYAYNYFGDIIALTEETTSNSFTYDGLGRLTDAYGRTYSYDGANRLTAFNGQSYGYGDGGPYHAVDRIGGADRFDYDANGNMTVRNKGLTGQQTLVWDAQNRLSEVRDNNGDMLEQYRYDVDGSRVKKVNGSTTTYTFFGHYEEEVTNGVTTAISHYTFGGLRVAVKRGNTLYHVHGDHLGSTSVTTAGLVVEGSRAYYPYGAQRSASGTLRTDRTFTGQKEDGTGCCTTTRGTMIRRWARSFRRIRLCPIWDGLLTTTASFTQGGIRSSIRIQAGTRLRLCASGTRRIAGIMRAAGFSKPRPSTGASEVLLLSHQDRGPRKC